MRVLITGADRPLGAALARDLGRDFSLRLTGVGASEGKEYRQADLRDPAAVAPLVAGMDAVIHAAPFDPAPLSGATAEQETLDVASRGTYVLFQEAMKAGAGKTVLISQMALMSAYPEEYVVDESWQPQPAPEASSLGPYLSELVGREFARDGSLGVVCLRFGEVGSREGTTEADAAHAVRQALTIEPKARGYRWGLFHVTSGGRFGLAAAAREPLNFKRQEVR
ncbi:MAG: NAD(P)-dependent oxidoreductase [Candidatus Latescibacteria bacterium]|nr:NAD(P)-dependent oxidoreductase [Candidatus Latescibacterota bacterium]